jgi:hypothetical protein
MSSTQGKGSEVAQTMKVGISAERFDIESQGIQR